MPEYLVDENLPRSLAPRLRSVGFKVQDVRDLGLRGASDEKIFDYARSSGLVLLSSDLGFGGRLRARPRLSGSDSGPAAERVDD